MNKISSTHCVQPGKVNPECASIFAMKSPPARMEPQTIVEVFTPLRNWLNVYGSVKQAIQDPVAPEIQKLHGKIKRLDVKLEGIEAEIEGLRGEMNERFDAVDRRFESADRRVESMEKRLESVEFSVKETIGVQVQSMDARWREAMDVHGRLATLEAKQDKR